MKKLFISQPMNGKTNDEISSERKKAIEIAKSILNDNVEVIDSWFKDAPHDVKPSWFLGKSLELLSTADVVYFADGWKNCRGCKIEHTCAVECGLQIIKE